MKAQFLRVGIFLQGVPLRYLPAGNAVCFGMFLRTVHIFLRALSLFFVVVVSRGLFRSSLYCLEAYIVCAYIFLLCCYLLRGPVSWICVIQSSIQDRIQLIIKLLA